VARGYPNGDLLALRRQERQVAGQGPSSRANARDLRKISPVDRNDNARALRLFDVAQGMLCANHGHFDP
jgi:hypothetical protein